MRKVDFLLQPLWDASALAKRYAPENGSETVDAIFDLTSGQMLSTFLGYAETFSLLLRKQNRGIISPAAFRTALSALQAETLESSVFNLLSISDSDIIRGTELMRRHNINASDAAILSAYLIDAEAQTMLGLGCVLIASDQRFLRAAEAEGLATLNPEAVTVPEMLSHL